jgi:hypothetical protein
MNTQDRYLEVIRSLQEINHRLQSNSTTQESLHYLQGQIAAFQVVVPVVGKFSSGKSTLLNKFLGRELLKCDIRPETSFATELFDGPDEHVLLHYLDGKPPRRITLEEFDRYVAEPDLYYAQVFINNNRLKELPSLVIVDMPGFDSAKPAHHKAISRYLTKGDSFICLMPSDIPFDSSIIEHLAEIRHSYGKDIACLISKKARKTAEVLENNRIQVASSLRQQIGEEVFVGTVEATDPATSTIADFEALLQKSAGNFSRLLALRFREELSRNITQLEQEVTGMKMYANSDEAKLEQQIRDTADAFTQANNQIENHIRELEYRLCSEGREQLVQSATSALSGAMSRLVCAARNNSLQATVIDVLRPVVQFEMSRLIESELQRLQLRLDQEGASGFNGITISMQIPAEAKEDFSNEFAMIAATVASRFLGPQGAAIVAMVAKFLAAIFGKKMQEAEQQRQIEEQIHNAVIPQAVSQVTGFINTQLQKAVGKLGQQLQGRLEEERAAHTKRLQQLQAEKELAKSDFDSKQKAYQQALEELAKLGAGINE